MQALWNCDLQGLKGDIWAGEWTGQGPFGALSGLQHCIFHFGLFHGRQVSRRHLPRPKNELDGPFVGQSG